jgi:hypothetical protein
MFSLSYNFHSRSIFGTRNVQLVDSTVEVHDFTKAQSAWEDQFIRTPGGQLEESKMLERSSPEELEGAHIYQDGVIRTLLPYRRITRNLQFAMLERKSRSVLCDDEHILLIQVNSPRLLRILWLTSGSSGTGIGR